jgi:hypothetical protein
MDRRLGGAQFGPPAPIKISYSGFRLGHFGPHGGATRRFPPPWSVDHSLSTDDDVLPAFRRRCLYVTALTPNAMEELFRNRCDIEIGQLAALVARFSERGSSIGEVPRTKLSIIAAKASGSSCVVR